MTNEQIQAGYFRLTALEACVFTFTGKSNTPNIGSVAYSLDEGSTWTSITVDTTGTSLPSLSAGDSVILRGTLGAGTNDAYITISADGDFDAGGNIMSFIVGDNFSGVTAIPNYNNAVANLFQNNTHLIHASNMTFPATTLRQSCYRYMFDGCTALVSPPQTISATLYVTYACQYMFRNCSSMTSIPSMYVYTGANYSHNGTFQGCTALTSASNLRIRGCNYYGFANTFKGCTALVTPPNFSEVTSLSGSYNFTEMFSGCTSLVTAPTIDVTGLQANCYQYMYYNCTSLKNPPALPATTLKNNCYQYMFYGCTSLETAPDLPATTLASNCYKEMFRNCSKLTFIKAMFTTTPTTSYTQNWVNGVSSTGIFVKNSEASWDVVDTYGVPTGWMIQNENAPVFVQRPTSPQIMLRRRTLLSVQPEIVLNSTDNPKITAWMYSKGYCRSPYGMTKRECAAVTGQNGYWTMDSSAGSTYEDFSAFQYFTGLTYVSAAAFQGRRLTGIVLPPKFTAIKSDGLRGCAFPAGYVINIPPSITSIEMRGIGYQNSYDGFYLIFTSSTPPTLGSNALSYCYVYVPDDLYNTYMTAWDGKTMGYPSGTILTTRIRKLSTLTT